MVGTEITVQSLILIGAIFGGFFALIKFLMTKQQKSTDSFLEYIRSKNGHMERIAKDFSDRIAKHDDTMTKMNAELARANDNQINIVSVLGTNASTLDRCFKALNKHEKETV